jgi:hypothetical protein
MATRRNYTFSGIVESVRFNLIHTAVFLPYHVLLDLPRGRVKASGIMNGAPFSLSILYRKDKGKYFPISASLRGAAKIEPGDAVNVSFRVIEMEKVEMPQELETVLNEDDKARQIWKRIPPTLKRVLAGYVESAKKIDVRMRRSLETIHRAKRKELQAQATRRKKNG